MMKRLCYYIGCVLLMASCVIENDIPYPIVEGAILSIEVEGQRAGTDGQGVDATINAKDRTIQLFVNDSVDVSKLKIKRLEITENARLTADSSACVDVDRFPTVGFASLKELSSTANTRVDFSKPVLFTVSTYQDYVWTVSVEQIVNREIDVVNQIGDAVIDTYSRKAVIYVSTEQSLKNLTVNKLNLGGEYGEVDPDPTTITDFSSSVEFYVKHAWEEVMKKWTVYVFHQESSSTSAEAFAMVTKASLTGKIQSGKTPVVEYKEQNGSTWNTLAASAVTTSGTSFKAQLTGLKASTTYQYRVSVDGITGEERTFTTADMISLENGNLDNWSAIKGNSGKDLWQPWADGVTSFWDTGNRGATTVNESNSVPTTETSSGIGKAALLESKYIIIRFAAGNIFTGSYKDTDGMNGVLDFGRPFNSFPTKLRVNYKYNCATIDKVGDDAMQHLKGRPDSCQIYIALTDWDQPLEIRTNPSNRQLFDPNDPKVIAYGTLIKGESVTSWTQADIELEYRYTNRTPKYLLIVASSSKYGDYFTGGVGSKLWLDNCELIYD
ncbi:MAG: PCMD domain-containing protein [Parabacteroides sp.]|nr:PCMD domain-containing protein [Parabacteroides sp.]